MYDLGLVSISFRNHSPEEILCAMKKAGLSVIEWGSDVHAKPQDEDQLGKIVALQKKYGISCCSYGSYFRLGVTPLEELEDYIKAAKLLGTDIIRIWSSDKGSAEFTESESKALFEEGRRAARIARKHGVTLCMECHNGTYTDTLPSALRLMREVGSEHFKMYWQPNQFRTKEQNEQYAAAIAQYVEIVHVFNWEGKEQYPLSQGVELWRQYLAKLKLHKPLLLEFMPDDRIETLSAEADALRRIATEEN